MNHLQAGLIDIYDNIEKRLGDKAWILPFAVAAGSFIFQKAFLHKSTAKALVSGAVTGVTTAGLVGAGKNMKSNGAMHLN